MKKIDLHIHTSPANYEKQFDFSLEKLREYVEFNKLDIIAITNHNHFDTNQYKIIQESKVCTVFPGIEVDIESSHLLVIASNDRISELEVASSLLQNYIKSSTDSITFDEFKSIFKNYNDYILIPHYKKDPPMKKSTLEKFKGVIKIGEVGSAKKFESTKKEDLSLVPVIFSDERISANLLQFSTKNTFVDIKSTEFGVLKNALTSKNNVFLSESKKDDEFAFLSDGTSASTKLNVILGKRSTGKTYNLDIINRLKYSEKIKYVPQFSLTGNSETEAFNKLTLDEQYDVINEYLKNFKKLTDDIYDVTDDCDNSLDKYLKSLKEYASNQSLNDIYSNTKMFSETKYNCLDDLDTKDVINALFKILDSTHNKQIISKYLSEETLLALLRELIEKRKQELLEFKLKQEVNDIVEVVKKDLTKKSAIKPIDNINFYEVYKKKLLIEQYNYVCNLLKQSKTIYKSKVGRFSLSVNSSKVDSLKQLKELLNTKLPLSTAYDNYKNGFVFLNQLKDSGVVTTEIYKGFAYFKVDVVNECGKNLSGGERAEYNLIKEIENSENYDILLLDEPEASFDNLFIKDYILNLIQDISKKTTVFVTTHNNSLGILLKPNKIIYTEKKDGKFNVYTGELGSKVLKTVNGKELESYNTIMEVMEAGTEAYNERKDIYESIKNS